MRRWNLGQSVDQSLNVFNRGPRSNECDDKLGAFLISIANHGEHVFHKATDVLEICLGAPCASLAASIRVLVEDAFTLMCYAFGAWCWGATTFSPAPLAQFTRGRGPSDFSIIARATVGRLVVVGPAAGGLGPGSNGPQRPAYITHQDREDRRDGRGGCREGEKSCWRQDRIRKCQEATIMGKLIVIPRESYLARAGPNEMRAQ